MITCKAIRNLFVILLIGIKIFPQPLNDFSIEKVTSNLIFSEGIFGASHASTIVEVDSGKFIVAWFAGSFEGANDVCIWTSKFNGNDWSKPNKIVSGIDSLGNQMPCWNPVLFKTEYQKLYLFYKVGLNPREWWGSVLISNDLGKSWEKPV
ncbi:MAG: exo-alpha-sialidase, partial [Ignavibacteriales bacterium]|nr:exo-alpha-sialidase [Ignavibacteriales bacterium]